MELENHASQIIGENKYKVRSQTNPDKYYIISKTDNGLVCDCPDHIKRKSDCKHIKVILEYCKKNVFDHDGFRIMERAKLKLCKFCDSGNIIKRGIRKTKIGDVQRYQCTDCKKRFTANFGFEKMRNDPRTITQALQIYYKGMSVRDIECNFEMMGIDVDHSSIYDWISKYSDMVSNYLNDVVPRTNDRNMVRADEVWVKVNGEQKFLFASMDDDTRYWLANDMAHTKFQQNADTLLEKTKTKIGKTPAHFVNNLGKRINKVSIVNEGDCIKVSPREWIDKHIWREINDILSLHKFSWLSNGKDSCWLRIDP